MTENEKKPTIAIIGGGRNAGRTIQAQMELLARIDELERYRAIGTIEECRTAVERMKPKKVKDRIDDYGDYFGRCPVCDRGVVSQFGTPYQYCPKCGIKLDWNE